MKSYEVLGLTYGASEEEVKNAYRQLAIKNNPQQFQDPVEKRMAQQKMEEIDAAFDEIMNYLRAGTMPVESASGAYNQSYTQNNSQRNEDGFYAYIRRLIQESNYDQAISQLNTQPNYDQAQWQFLMGSALYYKGFLNQSFPYFQRAVQLDPNNPEYSAAYGRLNQNRQGNIYGSPYPRQTTYATGGCCDPCTVCQCLVCMDCCCH